ncbi:MAG TPA: hypothetical protein ENJ37_05050 [Deltaproteobacteria bacterium]|nr:hypothetical protein [Deltaproteobacteria bacterium]
MLQATAVAGALSLLFYIFVTYPVIFHSDSAAYMGLAREQRDSWSLLPALWNYGTGIMLLKPTLLMHLFSPFLGYSIACRGLAVLAFIAALLWTVRAVMGGRTSIGFLVTASLLGTGVSSFFAEYMYGQASYLDGTLVALAAVAVSFSLLNSDLLRESRAAALTALLFFLVFFNALTGLSNLARNILPFVAVLLGAWVMDRRHGERDYRYLVVAGIWVLASLGGIMSYWAFAASKGTAAGAPIRLVPYERIPENARIVLEGLGFLFNGVFTGRAPFYIPFAPLNWLRGAFLAAVVFLVPLWMLVAARGGGDRRLRMMVAYYGLCLTVALLSLLLTTVTIDRFSSRYLVYPLFLSTVVLGMSVDGLRLGEKSAAALTAALLPFCLSSMLLLNAPALLKVRPDGSIELGRQRNHFSDVTAFLEAEGASYGYATFWNAGVITALSDWRVQTNQILINAEGLLEPYYWLSSRRWYAAENHRGPSFIMLSPGEEIDNEILFTRLGRPARELAHGPYRILAFDYNITERLPAWRDYRALTRPLDFRLPESAFRVELRAAVEQVRALPGEIVVVPVEITNRGTHTLCSTRFFPVRVGAQLRDGDGAMIDRDFSRTPLYCVTPGTTSVNGARFIAPRRPGRYTVEIDLVQENVAWFAQKGAKTATLDLYVEEGGGRS